MEATLTREFVHTPSAGNVLIQLDFRRCSDLRLKIQTITDSEYAIAKRDVEHLRAELGQPPLPNLQETLEERKRELVISHFQISLPVLIGVLSPPDFCTSNSPTIRTFPKPPPTNALTLLSMAALLRRVPQMSPRIQSPPGNPRPLHLPSLERGRGVAPKEARPRRRILTLLLRRENPPHVDGLFTVIVFPFSHIHSRYTTSACIPSFCHHALPSCNFHQRPERSRVYIIIIPLCFSCSVIVKATDS